ncbi:type II secretion system protein [Candidatus Sumerlaeota bacterium]|nr:type II secretion system protein [Candidatus Sumerlaeota bacterium]
MTRKHNNISSSKRGFSLTEVIIAIAIFTVLLTIMGSVLLYANRSQLSLTTQQRSLHYGQKIIEHMNREIRLASSNYPLTIHDADGSVAGASGGVEVRFQRPGDTAKRSYKLVSQTDASMRTPWDNVLIYDPDITAGGDETTLASVVSTLPGIQPFQYTNNRAPLIIRLRVGDPAPDAANPDAEAEYQANFRSGPGLQGFEINVTVAPRNEAP